LRRAGHRGDAGAALGAGGGGRQLWLAGTAGESEEEGGDGRRQRDVMKKKKQERKRMKEKWAAGLRTVPACGVSFRAANGRCKGDPGCHVLLDRAGLPQTG
jgi:hypothetical protein